MSDNLVGFKVADGYEDFSGGTVTYGAKQAVFNVGDAVKEADGGVFAVADAYLIESLRGYPALQEVPISGEVTPVEAPGGVQDPADTGGAPVGFIPQSGALPEQHDAAAAEQVPVQEQESQEANQTPPGGEQALKDRVAAANAVAEHADDEDEIDDDTGITPGR